MSKKYTRPGSKKGKQRVEESASVVLRSFVQEFNLKTHCFFCGEEASTRVEKNKGVKLRREIYEFKTIEIREKVIVRAQERKDQLCDVVLARAKSVIDLLAAGAKYHKHCYSRYFFVSLSDKSRGRPQDNEKHSAFDKLFTFLYENDECQYSISELEKRLMPCV